MRAENRMDDLPFPQWSCTQVLRSLREMEEIYKSTKALQWPRRQPWPKWAQYRARPYSKYRSPPPRGSKRVHRRGVTSLRIVLQFVFDWESRALFQRALLCQLGTVSKKCAAIHNMEAAWYLWRWGLKWVWLRGVAVLKSERLFHLDYARRALANKHFLMQVGLRLEKSAALSNLGKTLYSEPCGLKPTGPVGIFDQNGLRHTRLELASRAFYNKPMRSSTRPLV